MNPQYLFVYGTLRPQLANGEAKGLIAELEMIGSATVQAVSYTHLTLPTTLVV